MQVESAWSQGDVEKARHNSKVALGWNIAAIITGAVLLVILIPLMPIILVAVYSNL